MKKIIVMQTTAWEKLLVTYQHAQSPCSPKISALHLLTPTRTAESLAIQVHTRYFHKYNMYKSLVTREGEVKSEIG
jgi:hypothetical protein